MAYGAKCSSWLTSPIADTTASTFQIAVSGILSQRGRTRGKLTQTSKPFSSRGSPCSSEMGIFEVLSLNLRAPPPSMLGHLGALGSRGMSLKMRTCRGNALVSRNSSGPRTASTPAARSPMSHQITMMILYPWVMRNREPNRNSPPQSFPSVRNSNTP